MISRLEIRRTLRALAKSPGFTAVSVLSLAIGTGANVAIFGAVRVLLLDSLPLRSASQLVHFGWTEPVDQLRIRQINSTSYRDPDTGVFHRSNFTYAQYEALKRAGGNKIPITGYTFVREVSVAIDGQPPLVAGGLIADGDYFSTLGLQTTLGRPLTVADDRPDQPAVAVISHRLWTTAFSGDRAVVGRGIRVNGVPVEIVGVTQAGFHGLSRGAFFAETDITMPLRMQSLVSEQWIPDGSSPFTADNLYWLRIMARLPQPEMATALEQIFTPAFQGQLPPPRASAKAPVIRLLPGARGEPTSLPGERPLLILMGVVAIVLLIACINVAGLMLARGVARQREIAVRRAIGASRTRIIREVLLESAVVASAGTIAGVLFAVWARDLLASMLTSGLGTSGFGSVRLDMPIDWMLVASAGAIAMAVAIVCGVLPALRLSTVDASMMLKQRAAGALPTLALGRALLALQIGMSVPLLVGALVFLRTVGNLAAVELGFDPRGISFFRLNPSYAGVPLETHGALYLRVLQRVEALSGVTSASLVENAVMSGLTSSNRVTIDGREVSILMNAVGPGYFETMRMRVIAGRAPDSSDRFGRPLVAAVNQAAISQLFGGVPPIGQTLRVGNRDITIIGVVSDSRYARPRADVRPMLFDAALQRPGFGGHHVVIRAAAAPAALEQEVRRVVATVHPDLPVPQLRSQAQQIDLANARERVFAQLLTVFAFFAMLLAGIGLHGATAYSVTRRTNEIGVRVAVGATPRQIVWLILRHVAIIGAVGLAIGIPAAVALGPLVGSLLFGVAPTDTFLIACAACTIIVVTAVAALFPARQAARLSVADAIRVE